MNVALCAVALSACTAERPPGAVAECQAHQFAACDAACGRGVRYCDEESRTWSACTCVALDAGVDVGLDAPDDAPDAAPDAPGDVALDSD